MIGPASSDDEIIQFLECVKRDFPADAVLAATLAEILARSGETLCVGSGITADVASTGGPSSLSTLLCPLFLRIAGCTVPKLGVPGRPAGGIDCLAQLPSYQTSLDSEALRQVLESCGYAHFLASGQYAPLDARLFRLRQQHNAQAVPTLVAASLLSKKLAMGVHRAGLDIRVAAHGNFGRSWPEAESNATLFLRAARALEIEAFPVLTDARYPYQPFIGRREALVALSQIFEDSAAPWLKEHLSTCQMLALACVPTAARPSLAAASGTQLRQVFESNLAAQGSSLAEFDRLNRDTCAKHRTVVHAQADCFVDYSLEGIRRALVAIQAAFATAPEFPDPAGVILLHRPGTWVAKGEPVATLRLEPPADWANASGLRHAICRTSVQPRGPIITGVASV